MVYAKKSPLCAEIIKIICALHRMEIFMDDLSNIILKLKENNINYKLNENLAKYTSFKIGGKANVFTVPKNDDEIIFILQLCKSENIKYYFLGKGTNVLFSDNGYNGVIIHIGDAFNKINVSGNIITAFAGVSLSTLSKTAKLNKLQGVEFAYGIPGNVGGAIYMNAGAYGGEIKDVLINTTFIDDNFNIITMPAQQLELGYRTSVFEKNKWCILKAQFCLNDGNEKEIETKMNEFIKSRKEKQPLDLPSAGSAFKRPIGAYAGALIDECGLRGFAIGGAAISEKHCGFIVNLGGATCNDVLNLADKVCEIVKQKTGFTLEKEIRVVI